jgi:hypothetical protein
LPEICVGADYTAAAAVKVGLQSGGSALAFIFVETRCKFPGSRKKPRVVAAMSSDIFYV